MHNKRGDTSYFPVECLIVIFGALPNTLQKSKWLDRFARDIQLHIEDQF